MFIIFVTMYVSCLLAFSHKYLFFSGTGEMALVVKCFVLQARGCEFESRYLCEKPGMVAHACNSALEEWSRKDPWGGRQLNLISQALSERSHLRNYDEEGYLRLPLGHCTHIHMQTHEHKH